jgi:hypothetical protein
MFRCVVVGVLVALAAGCGSQPEPQPTGTGLPASQPAASPTVTLAPLPTTSDIATLSSEFDSATDLSRWTDLRTTEGGANWIRQLDVNKTMPGSLYLVPDVCSWYASYRGVFLYREVTGDAVLHLRLRAQGATDEDPTSTFSLGGAMLRVPEARGSAASTDRASWAFITLGAGDHPRQVETKTTVRGGSDLVLHPAETGWGEVVLARLGTAVITAYRPDGGTWKVLSRWSRPDLPARLQWGIAAYTDWRSFNIHPSAQANAKTWPGKPDLRLSVDFARFYRPAPPPTGVDLSDASMVGDSAVLTAITQSA